MPRPTALVTGATGLVGSYIIERLVADGWIVRGMVRARSASYSLPPRLGATSLTGDVLDADSFVAAARGCDVIFHAAATVTSRGGWDAFRPNVQGTANAIVAAERSGARLLHVSSVAVYGAAARYRSDARETDEDTPLRPLRERAHYARSKRESEQLVLDAHGAGRIWATAIRPDVVYGRRDRQFVPRVARLLTARVAPLVAGGRSTLAIVHAANVADGAVRAALHEGAGGRAYNLANDCEVTVRRFVELAAEGLGRRIGIVPVPLTVAKGGLHAIRFVMRALTGGRSAVVSFATLAMVTEDNPFTSERARRELGWAPPVRAEHGIPEAFRWWLTHR